MRIRLKEETYTRDMIVFIGIAVFGVAGTFYVAGLSAVSVLITVIIVLDLLKSLSTVLNAKAAARERAMLFTLIATIEKEVGLTTAKKINERWQTEHEVYLKDPIKYCEELRNERRKQEIEEGQNP